MIIDDEAPQREILERYIPKLGYTVKSAASARDALAILTHESFPLIITDLSMPGMDGLELCEQIKKIDSNVIIYALSGYIASFDEKKLEACGFDGYLSKPASSKILKQAIAGAFDKIEMMHER